jgi:hypothetical protein
MKEKKSFIPEDRKGMSQIVGTTLEEWSISYTGGTGATLQTYQQQF